MSPTIFPMPMPRLAAVAAAAVVAGVVALAAPAPAVGQSSSLFVHKKPVPASASAPAIASTRARRQGPGNRLSPAIAEASFSAVIPPQPRQFAINDLVTIIIREQITSDIDANLDAEKKSKFDGTVDGFPKLTLKNLANLQLQPSAMSTGPVKLGINYDAKFNGDGNYGRSDSMSGRITARVIDIKPNGTLVLEARKNLQSDDEGLAIVLTGTCRADDVNVDNTVLSSQLYDLHLSKQATGALRRVSQKGWLTRILDTVFNF